MDNFFKQFFSEENGIFVTEFGHSIIKQSKTVGPWSREIYILHFVTKGYCDFSGFRAESGQIFLISKGLRHSFKTSDNYEHFWIGFSGTLVEALFQAFGITSKSHQLFVLQNSKFAELLFFNTLKELTSGTLSDSVSAVLSTLMALLPLLQTKKSCYAIPQASYAEKVQRFILTNYPYPIKMSEIAEEIHITEKHMYKLFLMRFGMSPQKFLLKTRMEMAKKFLTEGDLTIKETAFSVGYTSLTAFYKAFSKYFGFPPGKYQNTKLE